MPVADRQRGRRLELAVAGSSGYRTDVQVYCTFAEVVLCACERKNGPADTTVHVERSRCCTRSTGVAPAVPRSG